MFAKDEISKSASVLACRQELKYLYARRSAIDSLIQSLEEYDRLRETEPGTASTGGGSSAHVGWGHPSHVAVSEGRGFWR
jgi:hypothetical protein